MQLWWIPVYKVIELQLSQYDSQFLSSASEKYSSHGSPIDLYGQSFINEIVEIAYTLRTIKRNGL